MFLGGGEYEDGVGRGLFEGLEKGVEGGWREHVDFVDDEDFVAACLGWYLDLLDELANVFDGVVGGSIEFVYVETASLVEGYAAFAVTATFAVGSGSEAVDGLGEDAGTGGLAYAAGTAEEIGVGELAVVNGVLEGGGEGLLTYDGGEGHGAVFAC